MIYLGLLPAQLASLVGHQRNPVAFNAFVSLFSDLSALSAERRLFHRLIAKRTCDAENDPVALSPQLHMREDVGECLKITHISENIVSAGAYNTLFLLTSRVRTPRIVNITTL